MPEVPTLQLARHLYAYGRYLNSCGASREARVKLEEAVELLGRDERLEPLALGRAVLALGTNLKALGLTEEARRRLRDAVELLGPYADATQEVDVARQLLESLEGS